MATRSIVVVQSGTPDKPEFSYNYVHFDGSTVGDVLRKYYPTLEQAQELLAMGDASQIGSSIEQSVFYHRDRGEQLIPVATVKGLKNLYKGAQDAGAEFVHIFRDGKWETYPTGSLAILAKDTNVIKNKKVSEMAKMFESVVHESMDKYNLVEKIVKMIIASGKLDYSRDQESFADLLELIDDGNFKEAQNYVNNMFETGTRDFLSAQFFIEELGLDVDEAQAYMDAISSTLGVQYTGQAKDVKPHWFEEN